MFACCNGCVGSFTTRTGCRSEDFFSRIWRKGDILAHHQVMTKKSPPLRILNHPCCYNSLCLRSEQFDGCFQAELMLKLTLKLILSKFSVLLLRTEFLSSSPDLTVGFLFGVKGKCVFLYLVLFDKLCFDEPQNERWCQKSNEPRGFLPWNIYIPYFFWRKEVATCNQCLMSHFCFVARILVVVSKSKYKYNTL